MARISRSELRELLERDLPGSLAPTRPRTRPAEQTAPAAERPRPRRGEEGPPDLLATDDAVIHAEHLPEVARYIRDQLDYVMLSHITATDYIAENLIEVLYCFASLAGGAPHLIKTRVPRDTPVVPSLIGLWPGAALQEREAFDLFGVQFSGHPNLTRVYMWDEFEGYPMRKDFPKQGDKYLGEDDEE